MKYILFILAVLVVVVIAYYLMRKPSEPIPQVVSTYEGRPEEHTGDKILLVAVYAKWASVWRATAEVLSGLDAEQYDLMLVNADSDRDAVKRLGVEIIPTVIVFQDGKEMARLPNLMRADQIPQPKTTQPGNAS